MKDYKKTDPEKARDLAVHAKALLEDKAFQYAMLELRKRWFNEVLEIGGGDLPSARLCAKINALESLARELAIEIDNYKKLVQDNR